MTSPKFYCWQRPASCFIQCAFRGGCKSFRWASRASPYMSESGRSVSLTQHGPLHHRGHLSGKCVTVRKWIEFHVYYITASFHVFLDNRSGVSLFLLYFAFVLVFVVWAVFLWHFTQGQQVKIYMKCGKFQLLLFHWYIEILYAVSLQLASSVYLNFVCMICLAKMDIISVGSVL